VLASVTFWGSTAVLGWVYVGYPALVAVLGRRRPIQLQPSLPSPILTVAIAAHDESAAIGDRIDDVLAQAADGARVGEILVGSDGSTDGTDAIVAARAAADPRIRLVALPRGGQTATQQVLLASATGDAVVLTDAETRFGTGCLAALGEALRDPRVGCATGRLEWRDESATVTSSQEGLYWRYERAIRGLESRAGLLTAVTGAVLAIRTSASRPVPPSASMDHLLPLYVREGGGLVLYVPEAVATDRPISGIREQFRNRTRTATRGIAANLSMAGRLAPWRRPGAALAIWSHKLLRWATPWFILLAGVAAWLLGGWYTAVPVAIGLGACAAVAGHLATGVGRRPPRIIGFARSFAVVNVAFGLAWLNVLFGRRIHSWHREEWDARARSPRGT